VSYWIAVRTARCIGAFGGRAVSASRASGLR
jgi:hypothetical protein